MTVTISACVKYTGEACTRVLWCADVNSDDVGKTEDLSASFEVKLDLIDTCIYYPDELRILSCFFVYFRGGFYGNIILL